MSAEQARALGELLSQDEFWIDVHGEPHFIREMHPAYRRNVVRFLERRAALLAFYAGLADAMRVDEFEARFGMGDMARVSVDRELEEEWDEQMQDPVRWLHTRPLVRALAC